MLTAADVMRLQKRYMISNARLASQCGRTIECVEGWRNGTHSPPPYLALVCEAIVKHRRPAPLARCRQLATQDVHEALGVDRRLVGYWMLTDQWPRAARLAIAALSIPKPLSPHRRNILRNINVAGTYWRVHGGFRARSVLGRRLPLIRLDTARDLTHEGFTRITAGKLRLTTKGKRETYQDG